MALYFGTTEITNIDNLVPQTGLDITDVWFGSTNVYTVWATYEGTLPATFNANGADMRQYQIYGNAGGVGEPTENLYDKNDEQMKNSTMVLKGSAIPEFYIPFGYQLDMSVKSAQLFDKNSEKVLGYINDQGSISQGANPTWTYDYFPIIGGAEYTYISYDVQSANYRTIRVAWYNQNKTFILRTFVINAADVANTVTAPLTAAYARLSIDGNVNNVMFNSGSSALPYEPYSNTTTSIYIGDDPLDKDEYVDYAAQKVYRKINDTLTPTDPPVPLPALPTCEGTTIVDYAGSGIAPEKVLLKYRKEGY